MKSQIKENGGKQRQIFKGKLYKVFRTSESVWMDSAWVQFITHSPQGNETQTNFIDSN